MSEIRLQYVFDPLCGWCYASAPALSGLATAYPDLLELMPSGLFADQGARALTRDWANYAWTNDQRIASLTGQKFSKAYLLDVLLSNGAMFDSDVMNRALTAVRAIDRRLEPGLLQQLQIVRYVAGQDTARADVVANVTAEFVNAAGHSIDGDELTNRLEQDVVLEEQSNARIRATQTLMNDLGVRGVPQLVVSVDGAVTVLRGDALYEGYEPMLAVLHTLIERPRPGSALS